MSSFPPHPNPLPEGEGELQSSTRTAGAFRIVESAGRAHPLPEGEGWGEGEERVRLYCWIRMVKMYIQSFKVLVPALPA